MDATPLPDRANFRVQDFGTCLNISYLNSFAHNLPSICEVAHSRGALVMLTWCKPLAIPVDVQALGVDFAATASYKWLMADFGLGVECIRQHSDRLTQGLRKELPRLGYACLTPETSRGPIVAFKMNAPRALDEKLRQGRCRHLRPPDVDFAVRVQSRSRYRPSVRNLVHLSKLTPFA